MQFSSLSENAACACQDVAFNVLIKELNAASRSADELIGRLENISCSAGGLRTSDVSAALAELGVHIGQCALDSAVRAFTNRDGRVDFQELCSMSARISAPRTFADRRRPTTLRSENISGCSARTEAPSSATDNDDVSMPCPV